MHNIYPIIININTTHTEMQDIQTMSLPQELLDEYKFIPVDLGFWQKKKTHQSKKINVLCF